MQLTRQDLQILRQASRDAQGRLSYALSPEGSLVVLGGEGVQPLAAGESVPRLERFGLLSRAVSHTLVLTPEGWDMVRDLVGAAN